MTEEKIEKILAKIADDLNISDEQYELAERKYKDIGSFLNRATPNETIDLYPQGSFALGTIIKPIDREDEYDLDFVCEFKKHSFTNDSAGAKDLKTHVQSLLDHYGKCDFIEKRRCWQVTYESIPQFHMDIIPAIEKTDYINITNKVSSNYYEFIGSNPQGYITWFKGRQMARYQILREELRVQAGLEGIKEYKIKTPLQKAIQILKRHRDVMFKDDKNNCKPISIIITTIATQIYDHEARIIDTLDNFLNKAEDYLETNKDSNGIYVIKNPTYTGGNEENFADKWIVHPERKTAFFSWLRQAKKDLDVSTMEAMSLPNLGQGMKRILGERTVQRVFDSLAKETQLDIERGSLKIDSSTGTINKKGTVDIPKTHHYGKISK